jgi:UPF0042 nucleotide-binding protein
MRLILVSGMSGAGKSVAIRLLEDIGFYCVDNLPSPMLIQVCKLLAKSGYTDMAVSIDSRSEAAMAEISVMLDELRGLGDDVRVLFLTSSTDALVQRFSETRRRHPLSQRPGGGAAGAGREPTLVESIEQERELLAPLHALGYVIDTSELPASTLRQWVRRFVDGGRSVFTLAFESFAFKNGVPVAADLVFDVRNLPNPYYETDLRSLTGLDAPVIRFLEASAQVTEMIEDITGMIDKWLPGYVQDGRQYLTVASAAPAASTVPPTSSSSSPRASAGAARSSFATARCSADPRQELPSPAPAGEGPGEGGEEGNGAGPADPRLIKASLAPLEDIQPRRCRAAPVAAFTSKQAQQRPASSSWFSQINAVVQDRDDRRQVHADHRALAPSPDVARRIRP